MTAYLIVRAVVPAADRDAFDRWYEAEHLPDGKKAFQALSAHRGWRVEPPGVHIAIYELADPSQARTIESSSGMTAMVAEFDRVWQGRVQRTREVIEVAQSL